MTCPGMLASVLRSDTGAGAFIYPSLTDPAADKLAPGTIVLVLYFDPLLVPWEAAGRLAMVLAPGPRLGWVYTSRMALIPGDDR